MQILRFDFLFTYTLDPIKDSKLWHMEEALESIEFYTLEGVHTEVNFGK